MNPSTHHFPQQLAAFPGVQRRSCRSSLALNTALAIALLTGIGASAVAQPYENPPVPSAPRALAIAAPTETRLPNGLRVVVAQRPGLPLVSAQLLVLAGSEADPPKKGGLAAITAGLLTKGTRRDSATAQASAAESLGGSLDSAAGWNRSSVAMTVTTPKLDAALALMSDAIMHPAFTQSELDRLRAQTQDELKVAYANPSTLAALVANRMLFGDGTYGHPSAGTAASLARLSRDDVRALHASHYRPDNAVLVLAGDITPAAALTLAGRHFGAWRAGTGVSPTRKAAAGTLSPSPLTLIDMGASGQAGVILSLRLPDSAGANLAVGEVTNAVLGGEYSSRMNQEIRIKRGLSYGANSSFDARRQASLLRVSVQTKNESAAEVLSLVQAELDGLIKTPVAPPELDARKATLIGKFSRSVETTAGLASQLAVMAATAQPVAQLPVRIDALAQVTADDVMAYARAHFGLVNRRIAIAGNAKDFESALKVLAPDLVVVKQEAVNLE